MADWFSGFEAAWHELDGIGIHARIGGRADAPVLLLLHGFPQTHAMWQRVAQRLAPHFRLALDHAGAVTRLALLDIAPTLDMYEATDQRFASAYYHWFHLIQPSPLPETMIGGNPRFYLHWKLGGWGSRGIGFIEPEALAEYERCFCRAETIHAVCEDYRAAAGIDLEHDRASRADGQKIGCDTLLLWGERGVVQALFDPLALWQAQCSATVSGHAMPAGHFLAEELPDETAAALLGFFA